MGVTFKITFFGKINTGIYEKSDIFGTETKTCEWFMISIYLHPNKDMLFTLIKSKGDHQTIFPEK